MALENARYTAIHDKTGSDKDKLKDEFDAGHAQRLAGRPDKEPLISSIMYQLGLMQEELDYLRGIISSNKDKTGITTAQANAMLTQNLGKGFKLQRKLASLNQLLLSLVSLLQLFQAKQQLIVYL